MEKNIANNVEVKNSNLAAQNTEANAIAAFIELDKKAREARDAQYKAFIDLLETVYGITLNSNISIDGKPFQITDEYVHWTKAPEVMLHELTKDFKVKQRESYWRLSLETLAWHKVAPLSSISEGIQCPEELVDHLCESPRC